MKLNKGQSKAIDMALNWYFMSSYENPLLAISGLAGTGKSTVLRYIIQALGLSRHEVLYTALTGKAVSVLRMKGHISNTVHKTFYIARKAGKKVYFKKKKSLPPHIKLIALDEAGMIGDKMMDDILSFGIPVIALGDHGQLPPLFDKNSFMTEEGLDIFLDEVMRTDDSSGILDIAMSARIGEQFIPGNYGRSRILDSRFDIKDYIDYDIVLCWTNKSRMELNMKIREQLGIESRYPTKGEFVYFLQNRYDISIEYNGMELFLVNGLAGEVLNDAEIIDDDKLGLKIKPDFIYERDIFFDVVVSRKIFDMYHDNYGYNARDLIEFMNDDSNDVEKLVVCDFAHAISVHASQGSEWDDILVIDEMPESRPEYKKWVYTAITRAKNSVDLLISQYK